GVIDPLEDERGADPGRVGDRLPAGWLRASFEELVGRGDSGRRELLRVGGPNALDLFDAHLHTLRSSVLRGPDDTLTTTPETHQLEVPWTRPSATRSPPGPPCPNPASSSAARCTTASS